MEYIVDLQGFQMSINQFVVKKIAVMYIESDVPLFEPPCVWASLELSEKNFMKCSHYFDKNANFQCALRNVQMLKLGFVNVLLTSRKFFII